MYIYEKINLEKNNHFNFIYFNLYKGKEKDRKGILDKHWHRSIEIIVPIVGSARIWTTNGIYTVEAGDLYIINSREVHSILNSGDNSYEGYVIQIEYDYLKKCYEKIDSVYFEQVIRDEIKEEILFYGERIRDYWLLGDEHSAVKIESYLLQIIYVLLTNQKKNRADSISIKENKNKERMVSIINYIDDNYREDLSVSKVADEFNLSYAHISRLFKENMQITIKEYINTVRLKKCEEYLVDTNYPIIQIAMDNGFPNIQSFYKEFKREYKITPFEYRKMQQNNNKYDSLLKEI